MTQKPFPGAFYSIAEANGKIFAGRKQPANLAKHMGDQSGVLEARKALADQLGCEIQWLRQVHGVNVFDADSTLAALGAPLSQIQDRVEDRNQDRNHDRNYDPIADAAITGRSNVAIAILTADCLPVMFSDVRGRFVAGAHAGWRGLANGVLDKTVSAFVEKGIASIDIRAFFGPAIGAKAFEVGDEVRQTFVDLALPEEMQATAEAFVEVKGDGQKWMANLTSLAAIRLARFGVLNEHSSLSQSTNFCTYSNPKAYFSYRYFCHHPQVIDGRQATLIWRSQ
jgi:polyphenol oxidase